MILHAGCSDVPAKSSKKSLIAGACSNTTEFETSPTRKTISQERTRGNQPRRRICPVFIDFLPIETGGRPALVTIGVLPGNNRIGIHREGLSLWLRHCPHVVANGPLEPVFSRHRQDA